MRPKHSFELVFSNVSVRLTLSTYACAARRARGREGTLVFNGILRLSGLGRGTLEEGEQYLIAST